jgi:hypothetical protein
MAHIDITGSMIRLINLHNTTIQTESRHNRLRRHSTGNMSVDSEEVNKEKPWRNNMMDLEKCRALKKEQMDKEKTGSPASNNHKRSNSIGGDSLPDIQEKPGFLKKSAMSVLRNHKPVSYKVHTYIRGRWVSAHITNHYLLLFIAFYFINSISVTQGIILV